MAMGYDQGVASVILAPRSTWTLCPLKNLSWFEHFSSACVWASSGRAHLLSLATFSVESRGVILSYQWKYQALILGFDCWEMCGCDSRLWLCHLFPHRQLGLCISCCLPRSHHRAFWADCWQFCVQTLWKRGSCCPELGSWTLESAITFLIVVWHWADSSNAQHLIHPQILAVAESFYVCWNISITYYLK